MFPEIERSQTWLHYHSPGQNVSQKPHVSSFSISFLAENYP